MPFLSSNARRVLEHPGQFALQTLRSFNRNQGLMWAGAIAYYALLSLVPLVILCVVAVSQVVDRAELLTVIGRYAEWLVPNQSQALMKDVTGFLENTVAIGSALVLTMLFFSSLAFSVLEKAMHVIFAHRREMRKRHFLVSTVLPYCFVTLLGLALLGVTAASVALQSLSEESLRFLGRDLSLDRASDLLLYLLGPGAEAIILTVIYLVMPVGRMRLRHALIGGVTATLIWELLRQAIIWYFTTFSKASVVYGSLTTAVVALFSMEIAAAVLLFGAQVMSEYERFGRTRHQTERPRALR